jgi:hypothetical protein
MRHVFGVIGVLAAGVLLVVSAAMNWRFGYSLGRSEVDGLIYAWASTAADCLKALVPFFFFASLRNRVWSQAAAAGLVGAVVTAYSLASALGHAAVNRNDTASQRTAEARAYEDLRTELGRIQGRVSWIAAHRPPATVEADLGRLKSERLWEWSVGCTQIKGKAHRDFCRTFHTLEAELASGREAAALEARIDALRSELAKRDRAAALGEADPQAAVLGKLLGLRTDQVQFGLVIFVAILLEVGSSMGMYMAFSAWRIDGGVRPPTDGVAAVQVSEAIVPTLPALEWHAPTPLTVISETADGSVREFVEARVVEAPDDSCSVISVYDGYRIWCAERDRKPLSLPTFVRTMDELGLRRLKTEDGGVYAAVGLKGGAR